MMLWDHGHPYIQSTPVLCTMLIHALISFMKGLDSMHGVVCLDVGGWLI